LYRKRKDKARSPRILFFSLSTPVLFLMLCSSKARHEELETHMAAAEALLESLRRATLCKLIVHPDTVLACPRVSVF